MSEWVLQIYYSAALLIVTMDPTAEIHIFRFHAVSSKLQAVSKP